MTNRCAPQSLKVLLAKRLDTPQQPKLGLDLQRRQDIVKRFRGRGPGENVILPKRLGAGLYLAIPQLWYKG